MLRAPREIVFSVYLDKSAGVIQGMSPPKYSLWSVGGVLPPITVATSPIFFHCQRGGIGQGASGGEGESSGRMARARSLSSSASRSFSAIGRSASLRRNASLLLTISFTSNPIATSSKTVAETHAIVHRVDVAQQSTQIAPHPTCPLE